MTPAETKAIALKIYELLPDDPSKAMAALALAYACLAVATKCEDDNAIHAVRLALRQMHADGGFGLDS